MAVGLITPPANALHPNHPLARSPEGAYQSGPNQIDHVDLFSGSLSMAIPIGPFTLNYSSNIWRYKQRAQGANIYTEAYPDRERNSGLGWHLGWGEIYSPDHWYNETDQWMYVGEDGGRHFFHQELHQGENDGDSTVLYTRDNTYLRLRFENNFYVDLEFPDGATRRFNSFTGGLASTYRLEKGWTRFTSAANPDFSVDYSGDPLLWTLTDRYGRSHSIHFTDQYDTYMNRVITRVDVESFGGQTASYDFSYVNTLVSRSCKDDDPLTNDRIPLPHLQRIDLPDGTFYEMGSSSNLFYYNLCENGIEDVPGVLRGIRLPTGGKIGYAFQEFEFPPGDTNSPFNTSAGVALRVLGTAADEGVAQWTYRTTQIPRGDGGTLEDDPQMVMEVVYKDKTPSGYVDRDCTKHYFNARYWQTPSEGRGWEYGLPFVYTEQSGGRYLSSQVWTSTTAAGACAGTKLRSSYLSYRRDATPGSGTAPASEWYQTNRQVQATRTVFHDDGNRWVDSESSRFDGLGHFRQVKTTGNLWSGSSTNEERTVVTEYNRSLGDYPGSYVPVSPSTPWLLGIFRFREVSEPDALGGGVARTEYTFSNTTGFLGCTRVLESGTSRGPHDLLSVRQRDSLGQVTDVKSYGGDLETLSTTAGCSSVPAQPQRWQKHTYQNGVRRTTRAFAPNGTPAPFYSYDVDIDASTGVVTKSRDSAGFETTLFYDATGRLDKAVPQAGAEVRYLYTNPNPATLTSAKVKTQRVNTSGTVVTEAEVILDDFGRTWKSRRKMPGGVWVEQETLRNGRGWPLSISEWGDPSKVTEYLGYDPFGRATTVRPPDGAAHDLRRTYTGARIVVEESAIALAGGETFVPVTRELDSYGRLRKTLELSGTTLPEATTYLYDVGGRLAQIASGNVGPQVRLYDYDNRGFLLAETHPEKGSTGNGTVLYSDYDVTGQPLRFIDGPNDLKMTLDPFGRLTEVRDQASGNRLVKELEYDGGLGFGLGKVWKTRRHNWVNLGVLSSGGDQVVEEIFSYQGQGGAVSKKETHLAFSSNTYSFEQGYLYNQLGLVRRTDYPECTFQPCTAATGAGRQISASYNQGLLNQMPGWVTSVSYHPNSLWDELHHANGVIDHLDLDASHPSRLGRLRTTGSNQVYDSQPFAYDGAGNIKAMGTDSFAYDGVSRLVSAAALGITEDYEYDRSGNLTKVTTFPQPGKGDVVNYSVNGGTNRLNAASYDGAGNLTSWAFSTYTYNTDNQISTTDSEIYLYNASGERVVNAARFARAERFTVTLRDQANRPLSLLSFLQGTWHRDRDYVYAGDRLIASDGALGRVHYHLDHLGSPRLLTDGTTGNATDSLAFLPYGKETTGSNASYQEPLQFTGHERDQSTGLDNMHARHYSAPLGRFVSVDPLRGSSDSPQSLNRYAYVLGNPINFTDPDGRRPSAKTVTSLVNKGTDAIVEGIPNSRLQGAVRIVVGGSAKALLAAGIAGATVAFVANPGFWAAAGIAAAITAHHAGDPAANEQISKGAQQLFAPIQMSEETRRMALVAGIGHTSYGAGVNLGMFSNADTDSSSTSEPTTEALFFPELEGFILAGGIPIPIIGNAIGDTVTVIESVWYVSKKSLEQIAAETLAGSADLTAWGNLINPSLNLPGGGTGGPTGCPPDASIDCSSSNVLY